jgi:hypothetical protein
MIQAQYVHYTKEYQGLSDLPRVYIGDDAREQVIRFVIDRLPKTIPDSEIGFVRHALVNDRSRAWTLMINILRNYQLRDLFVFDIVEVYDE